MAPATRLALDGVADLEFRPLRPLQDARAHQVGGAPVGDLPGAVLERIRAGAAELREQVRDSGRPTGVATRALVTQPHATSSALFGAVRTPAPWVWLTDRMVVVTWREGSRTRTLLWNPSDHELAGATAGVRWSRDRLPLPSRFLTRTHGTAAGHVRTLGIDPQDVDYLCFPHLQTQDVRRLLGTRVAVPDLPGDGPLPGWFPNAKLVVQRAERETLLHRHPMQERWYQRSTFAHVDPSRILELDGDRLLGPGVALVCTPGLTMGTQSLVLHTRDGIQVASGNGVAPDVWAPTASRLPGVRRFSLETGLEVIPRSRSLEFASWQYASMVGESVLADRTPDARFPLILPAAGLDQHRLAPGFALAARKRSISHGRVLPSHARDT